MSQPPKMDLAIVKRLFEALFRAQTGVPSSFVIDSTNDEGMGQLTVLVMDTIQFDRLVKPILGDMEMPKS